MKFDEMVPWLQKGKYMKRPNENFYIFSLPIVDTIWRVNYTDKYNSPLQYTPTIQDLSATDWKVLDV